MAKSPVKGKYDQAIDREFAYEVLAEAHAFRGRLQPGEASSAPGDARGGIRAGSAGRSSCRESWLCLRIFSAPAAVAAAGSRPAR